MTLREYINEYGNDEIAIVRTMCGDELTLEEALDMVVIMTTNNEYSGKCEIVVA